MEITFWLYALLAHCIGDFVLQTNKIAKMKAEGLQGIVIHSCIIALCNLVCLSVFGWMGIAAGLIISGIHCLTDIIKFRWLCKMVKNHNISFFIDQFVHLATIFGVSLQLNKIKPMYFIPNQIILVIIASIAVTYIATIVMKQLLFDFKELQLGKVPFFEEKERFQDALFALLIFSGQMIYLDGKNIGIMIALFYHGYYIIKQKQLFNYNRKIIGLKIVFYWINSMLWTLIWVLS